MATAKKETQNVTGLDSAQNRKEAEYDLVKSLLAASDFKNADDQITEVEIKRAGKYLFTVHIHPISDTDSRFARKKATTYMPNPVNKKLAPVEKEYNSSKFCSWLIYIATTEDDQQQIWGNPAIMNKFTLAEPWESIDCLLTLGEKRALLDQVLKISGMDDDDDEEVEIDEETFQ